MKSFYDVLEPKIREMTQANQVDDKLQMELTSILLIIMYSTISQSWNYLLLTNQATRKQCPPLRTRRASNVIRRPYQTGLAR